MRQCPDHTQVPLNSCDQTREDTEEVPDTVSESAGQGGNQPRPPPPVKWGHDTISL